MPASVQGSSTAVPGADPRAVVVMVPYPFPLAGAGTFVGSSGVSLVGAQPQILSTPSAAILLGSVRRVTLTFSNATAPTAQISDTVGSTFTPIANQPAGQLQWTAVAPNAMPKGGNTVKVVFPSAIQKGQAPALFVEDFNPSGQ